MYRLELVESKKPVDLRLKYYTSFIQDKDIKENIIKAIEFQGDRQNHKTNVKAQMTDWRMQDQKGFKELDNIIIPMLEKISETQYSLNDIQYRCSDMWGMKYSSEDIAIYHDHFPATWSIAYYINPPENSPGLIFTDYNEEVKLKDGLIVIFPGTTIHSVPKKKFKGNRYVVSANYHVVRSYGSFNN